MKKGLFVLFILSCMAWASESIRVEVKDEQPTNDQMLGLRLRVVNNSGRQYNGIQVKYYLKKQPADNFVIEPYYMGNLSAQLEEFDDTTVVLKVNVPVLGTGNTPDATGISVGVHRSGWGSIHKESVPGCPGAEFAEAASYGVYSGDNLIAGNLSSEGALKLRFVGLRPETADSASPWVQLQNYGGSAVSLNGVKIKDASGNLYSLGGITLGARSTLRVCSGQISNCSNDSVVTTISGLSFGNVGEFILYQDSVPLDYIAWGDRGNYADLLEVENKIINPDYFFNTSTSDDVVGPVSVYRMGDFFRAVIMDGSDSIISWNKFREKMIDSPFSQWPYAEPLSLWDSCFIYKRNMEETMLAWNTVAGARFYEVTVLNANDTTLVYHGYTDRNRMAQQLGEGKYLWLVNPVGTEGEDYSGAVTSWNAYIPLDYYCYFEVGVLDGTETPVYDLQVSPLAARKDSYMLDLKWGEHIIEADWDRPHNSTGYVDGLGNRRFRDINHYYNDPEESWRCWAVAAAMVNHKYGGNLTQDEIKFHFKINMSSLENPILNAFPHDKAGGGSFGTVIPWVMNLDPYAGEFTYSDGMPSDAVLLGALAAGNLVVVDETFHVMVIDAVVYSNKRKEYVYRFLNIDNDGTVEWRRIDKYHSNEADFGYWIMSDPKLYGKMARKSELYEDNNNNGIMDFDEIFDADGDTLLDFDEIHRFHTDPNNPDTDGDGIFDKTEIMSYTIREPYPKLTPDDLDLGVSVEVFANIDGDVDENGEALRAERDPDSDNDGRLDGQEDINANGLRDNYETDVYAKDADQVVAMSNAEHVTLYALSELRYNDGVVCYNGRMQTGRCIIASAALGLNGEYAVNVGARADVGDILSRGNVILRSNTHVRGGVYLIEGSNVDDIFLQNGATIDKGISRYTYDVWDLNFYPRNYAVDDLVIPFVYDFVVHDGEVRVLSSGIYSTVKVEGGGLLYIPPGTVYTGSIQLDPRSNVMFNLPGRETVIHVSGDFTWRAKTLNEPEQYPFIAQGFKLVQHARGKRMYVENMVAGSIVAPYSDVIIAQSRKLFYGKIFANNITVHQYAKIYHVDFSPIQTDLVVSMEGI
ncbi:MAG: hypothetical protein J6W54_00470 [Fibrobacter sp.]|uniref:hypothetical protein n=1 Tax=Fibrobacter sp. TaxID=35828 RepID=UPI001B0ECC8B|nr:hypothetical protein [Fibrobacter sp.]MBO7059562.1 hypothetical protein [Fibrobacter sp.]MBO7105331.1 hypothetical protein [Fibrobacter sp.]